MTSKHDENEKLIISIYSILILQWTTPFRRLALYGFRVRLQERKVDLAHLILLS